MVENILTDNLVEALGTISATSEIVRIDLLGVVDIDGKGNPVLGKTLRLAFSASAFQRFSKEISNHANGISLALGASLLVEVEVPAKATGIPAIGDLVT